MPAHAVAPINQDQEGALPPLASHTPDLRHFAGYNLGVVLCFIAVGYFVGLLTLTATFSDMIPRHLRYRNMVEFHVLEISYFQIPGLIGMAFGGAIGLILARAKITISSLGFSYQGLFRETTIPWDEIEKVEITLEPGRRASPPFPVYRVRKKSAPLLPYKIFLDLPSGARRRLQESIEDYGIPVGHNRFMFIAPLLWLLNLGVPIALMIFMF